MRALLVTSAVTFVPENYNRLICRLADHSSVVGLLELDNREPAILLKAIGMVASFTAPRMGSTLIRNYFGSTRLARKKAFEQQGKFYRVLKSMNDPEALKLIQEENIDLIINARTRVIFKKEILTATRLGCINIHHGLLPEQRGLMCDFWAHLEEEPFGFSVHQMTSKIDDGPILHVQQVESERTHYLKSILKASEVEAEVCGNLLSKIQIENRLTPLQMKVKSVKYRKNPALFDGYKLQIKGIKI